MTQIGRYAQMMKVGLDKVEGKICVYFSRRGSVLAQTVQAIGDKIEVHYEIESSADPARVAGVLRNARNGCYARSVTRPELFQDTVYLNGKAFALEDYPP